MIVGHGDDLWRFGRPIVANFSSNVFGGVDLTPLKEHLAGRMEAISHYPEPEPYKLEKALAAQHGIAPECVCVTNGATEAIYLIAQAWGGAHSSILQPTFSEYADACRLHSHSVAAATRPLDFARGDTGDARGDTGNARGDTGDTRGDTGNARGDTGNARGDTGDTRGDTCVISTEAARPSGDISLFWMCNPNNPDGRVIPKAQLQALISSKPTSIFVIDQSYGFFTEEPLITPQEAIEHGNVLQLHSMTKRYAMPGLRLGYVVGSQALVDRIRSVRMPWSVNALAIEAGLFLAEHPGTAPIDKAALLREAQRLRNALNAIPGIYVQPTKTHFMICEILTSPVISTEAQRSGEISRQVRAEKGISAGTLKQWLMEHHGLLIRDASNFEGLTPGHFRIAAQTPEQNNLLINAIREYLL